MRCRGATPDVACAVLIVTHLHQLFDLCTSDARYSAVSTVPMLSLSSRALSPFPRILISRCCSTQTHNTSLLSHLSQPDVLRLLSRLSPLALHAHSHHAHLSKSSQSASLSPAHVSRLRQLSPLASLTDTLHSLHRNFADASSILDDSSSDEELRALAIDEQQLIRSQVCETSVSIISHLLVADPTLFSPEQETPETADAGNSENNETLNEHDSSVALVEVRAGTGGDEAALFAAELTHMYAKLSEHQQWDLRTLSKSQTDLRGVREAVLRVSGACAHPILAREAGVHRVQRVPSTEGQGRVHTSTASVAVLREARDGGRTLRPADVRIDVYRASGAGGQHVNRTESAVRATHLPTGLVATCQDDRSQHRNRAAALSALAAKVAALEAKRAAASRAGERRAQLGATAGERSDRIRTYNFPQRRVTDHRVVPHDAVLAVVPSARGALGEKTVGLEAVLEGGDALVRLNEAVGRVDEFDRLARLIKLADGARSDESEQLSRSLASNIG